MTHSTTFILYVIASMVISVAFIVHGMPASPFGTFREPQPDGTFVTLRLHGDPNDSWMTDEDEYTVIRHPVTGYFVYAESDEIGGIKPSSRVVKGSEYQEETNRKQDSAHYSSYEESSYSKHPPGASSDSVSLDRWESHSTETSPVSFTRKKNIRPAKRDCQNKICGHVEHKQMNKPGNPIHRRKRFLRIGDQSSAISNSTHGSTVHPDKTRRTAAFTQSRLRNLVLLMRWSDHADRRLPSREEYDVLMNNEGPDPFLCPTGSVRDVFLQNSYGALEVDSYVIDWIPMDQTEEYYSNGEKGTSLTLQEAIRYALAYVDHHKLVDFDFFDEDQDGYIDSITFIHSGYGAERGGTDAFGKFFEDRIWSHKWELYYGDFQSKWGRKVRVSDYHISSGLWGLEGSQIGRIGVIAHEMAHFLGLPDLYDYDSSSNGLGNYGLMSNSWGANGLQLHPPHMSAWAKMILGWVRPVEPQIGINVVEASAEQNPTHPQVYIIKEGFPDGEFLLIENRQPVAFDVTLPQGGLAIWHVDYGTSAGYDIMDVYVRQSQEGHPWQDGWPENGNHYPVALLQADGYYDLERGFNHGDHEDLFHASYISRLVPCILPNRCQYPNTDSYRSGNVARSNVHITDISESGDIMTFRYGSHESFWLGTLTPTTFPTSFPTSFDEGVNEDDDAMSSSTDTYEQPSRTNVGRALSMLIIVSPILLMVCVGLVFLTCARRS